MRLEIKRINAGAFLRRAFVILAAALALGAGADACRRFLFEQACRVKADCRGKGIGAETFKDWEKQGKNRFPGIGKIAGWRVDGQQEVSAFSTGRKQNAKVICAFGSMELVEPSEILCGRFGLAAGEDFCVLSETLSRNLFGSTDTAGEWVKMDGKRLQVAGVIAREEDFLLVPMEDGEAEQLAVEFKGRIGAEEGIRRLLGE